MVLKLDHSLSPTIKLSGYFSRLREQRAQCQRIPLHSRRRQTPTANRNYTTRLNFDQTPLRQLCFCTSGIGYIHQYQPTDYPNFDQTTLGMNGYFQTNRFPSIGGFFDGSACDIAAAGTSSAAGMAARLRGIGSGLHCIPLGRETYRQHQFDLGQAEITFSNSAANYIMEGYPEKSGWRANGSLWHFQRRNRRSLAKFQPLNFTNPTGFNYASFLLGLPDDIEISPNTANQAGQSQPWGFTRRIAGRSRGS